MKRAEITAALIIALFSIYAAWKSTELPIGWVRGRGPGGGAFPFYLSLIMLFSAMVVIVRALRGKVPAAWRSRPYFEPGELKGVFLHAASILVAVASIYVIGTYGAIILLLVFHMRVMGSHSWRVTITVSLVTAVAVFLFFEILMQQIMPKGYTDPLFDPVFEYFNAPSQ